MRNINAITASFCTANYVDLLFSVTKNCPSCTEDQFYHTPNMAAVGDA